MAIMAVLKGIGRVAKAIGKVVLWTLAGMCLVLGCNYMLSLPLIGAIAGAATLGVGFSEWRESRRRKILDSIQFTAIKFPEHTLDVSKLATPPIDYAKIIQQNPQTDFSSQLTRLQASTSANVTVLYEQHAQRYAQQPLQQLPLITLEKDPLILEP